MKTPRPRRLKSFKEFIRDQKPPERNNWSAATKPLEPTKTNGDGDEAADTHLIYNETLTFRCPNVLRERLEEYGYDHDMGLSEVIRLGCATLIRNNLPTRSAAEAPSQSITMDANGQFGTKATALTRKT